jgi:LacI family transcriptional regulator
MKQKERKSVLLLMGWYVHEINLGVSRYANEHGWLLDDVACHTGQFPPSWKGDGVLTIFSNCLSQELVRSVINVKVPVVGLCDHFPEIQIPRVVPDNEAIGRTGANEFISRGFEHYAFLVMDREAPVVKERLKGFRDTVTALGKDFTAIDYTDRRNRKGANEELLGWIGKQIKALPKPLAVMAQYDGDANLVVRACLEVGFSVPLDVAVIGADNDPLYCEVGPVPLTSVITNREKLGYEGAAMLDRLMKGEKVKSPVRIPPVGIALRRSSDIFSTEDIELARALNFIARNLRNPIQVEDVVRESGSSRRALYNKFSTHVGHSIHQEILRQRLNLAKRMLQETDQKIDVIAYECGFCDGNLFRKIFRRYEKTTLQDVRRRSLKTDTC